jgi:hypothetical protein
MRSALSRRSAAVASPQAQTAAGAGSNAKTNKSQGSSAPGEGVKEAGEAVLSSMLSTVEASGPRPDPYVSVAFSLGWQMAELYQPATWPVEPPAPAEELPGLNEFSGAERALLGLHQVDVALSRLDGTITEHGLTAPTTKDAKQTLEKVEPTDQAFREKVFALHKSLLSTLTAASFKVGKAYGLGRELADITRRPSDLSAIQRHLAPERVATVLAWLTDLTSTLPAHAGHSVDESLKQWRDWALKPSTNKGEDDPHVIALLRRQGERWRALLSAEQQPTELLDLQSYMFAGSDMLRQLGALSWRFLRRFAVVVIVALLLFAGGVALILTDSSSGHLTVGIGGILASFGVTWKGAGNSLGKAAGNLERPVWEAALDGQIADALTLLPGSKQVKGFTPPPAITEHPA